MFKKFLFLPVVLLVLLSSCTFQVVIDNPTDMNLKVSLDDKEYDIAAFAQQEVELKKAEVRIVAKDEEGNEILNETVQIAGAGIINPTRTTYVIFKDLYCLPENYDLFKSNLDIKEIVVVNDKEYESVDFTLVEDLFIPKTWDYNLNESFPDSVNLEKGYVVKSKIYRVEDIESEFGYFGDIDFTDFDEADVNAFMDSLRQLLNLDYEEEE